MNRLSPGLLEWAVILLGMATLWVILEPLGWVAGLAAHWRLHVALVALGISAWAGARRRVGLAAISVLCVGLQAHAVVPELQGTRSSAEIMGSSTASGPGITLLSLNVHMTHRDFPRVADLIQSESPDLVLLVEVDDGWIAGLEPALEKYPHRYLHPRSDFLGLGIYSRLPLRDSSITHPGGPDGPLVSTEVQVGAAWVWLGLIHGLPPIRASWAESQSRLFQSFTSSPPWGDRPILLCGDFNAAPWSRGLRDMRESAGLRHARDPGWPTGTWPTWAPAALRLPIDHCLLSPEVLPTRYRVGEDVGSDHLPLLVELTLRAPPQLP